MAQPSAWAAARLLDRDARRASGDRQRRPPARRWSTAALGEADRRHRCSTACARIVRLGNAAVRPWRAGSARRSPDELPDAGPGPLGTEARWAWINHGFLDWQDGFGGTLVVHGHTPPREALAAHAAWQDPHLFLHDRLGPRRRQRPSPASSPAPKSSDGRYRILKAGTAFETPISSVERGDVRRPCRDRSRRSSYGPYRGEFGHALRHPLLRLTKTWSAPGPRNRTSAAMAGAERGDQEKLAPAGPPGPCRPLLPTTAATTVRKGQEPRW